MTPIQKLIHLSKYRQPCQEPLRYYSEILGEPVLNKRTIAHSSIEALVDITIYTLATLTGILIGMYFFLPDILTIIWENLS